jgi:FkbM family methyltransferase
VAVDAGAGSGGTVPPDPWVSYAQNGEDVRLHRVLSGLGRGRYLEVGAADPVRESVTYGLYRDGWDGIVVEPVLGYAEDFARARPRDVLVQAAAGSARSRAAFHEIEGTGLSTLDASIASEHEKRGFPVRTYDVDVLPLDEVLADAGVEPGSLHVVVIDVEGWERQVLQGLDLRRWRPWVLVVEAVRPGSQQRAWQEWEDLVLSSGYVYAAFDGLNRFYVSPDHLELVPGLETPPNPFDGFTTQDRVLLNEAVAYYRDKAELAEEDARQLRSAVAERDTALAQLREQHAAALRQTADAEALASGLAVRVLRTAADTP